MDNQQKERVRAQETDANKSLLDFPVVGIGASAGGLEAIQEFFKYMPSDIGAAFVVVQHLSPDYKSFMDELISRHTSMSVEVITDGTPILVNHIYLIPPKSNLTVFNGTLYLNEISALKTLNLPIDIFFRSLAKDQEKNAIAIVLSGTGSDGTLGIKAIKEFGGVTMVQDDKTAKFDGMPRSSIATGMVDIVRPPRQLAEELENYIKHPFVRQVKVAESLIDSEPNQLKKVLQILNSAKNVDFSCYKESSLIRRLEKRISINRFDKIEDYTKFLAGSSKETEILFNELLIGVTRFFRDEAFFYALKENAIGQIIENATSKREVRIWVAACSTGEEAYSIAILIKEFLEANNLNREVKIFATDLDSRSLEIAGIGIYPDNIVSDVSPDRLTKYFTRKDGGYQVNESIRSMLIFAKHNLINDPPFSKLDLISCRNLLIYLNNEMQQKIISTFNISLCDKGILFLGSSESLGNAGLGFNVIDSKAKIFQKKFNLKPAALNFSNNQNIGIRTELLHHNFSFRNQKNKNKLLEGVFDQVMGHYLAPSVIIDEHYEVLHTIGNVNKYLGLPVGQVSLNLMRMLAKEHAVIITSLIRRADKCDSEVVTDNISFFEKGKLLKIKCLKISDKLNGSFYYLITFVEQVKSKKLPKTAVPENLNINLHYNERIEELEKELQMKSESLQATVEELETSNEELQSSNEELIAANEELQSTNEELQSVNEELYTVNSEHIKKIDELTEITGDFENLLKNTKIGNLYLDTKLNIRKINQVAVNITNILPSDIGRPIHHLSLNNLCENLVGEIVQVSDSLQPVERDIEDKNGNWYFMRIFPYRTVMNAVEGIIVTFVDITKLNEAQRTISKVTSRLENALEMGEMSWWEWDYTKNEVKTGASKYTMLGYAQNEVGKGYQWWTGLIHPEDLPQVMKSMEDHLNGLTGFYLTDYRIKHKLGHYIRYRDKGGIISRTNDGKPQLIVGVVMKVGDE